MNPQILIVDFGSQLTKLIARRIRDTGIFCEIEPFQKINRTFLEKKKIKGFILSGSPSWLKKKNSLP